MMPLVFASVAHYFLVKMNFNNPYQMRYYYLEPVFLVLAAIALFSSFALLFKTTFRRPLRSSHMRNEDNNYLASALTNDEQQTESLLLYSVTSGVSWISLWLLMMHTFHLYAYVPYSILFLLYLSVMAIEGTRWWSSTGKLKLS